MTTTAADDLLLTEEVAEILRVPVDTLRYWRSVSKGPRSGKFGRRVVYRRRDIDAWIKAQFDSTGQGDEVRAS